MLITSDFKKKALMDTVTNKKTFTPLIAIFITICIDMIGLGVLIPVFPLLVLPGPYKITPDSWSLSSGFILMGWLSATYPIAQFLCSPILGQLSDRYGRKIILTLSITGTCISYILFAIGIITKNIPLMFGSRLLDGMTGGNISVAQAVIADISTPKSRAKNFGLIGMAFGLGFILGPFLGGELSDSNFVSWFGAAMPFYFASLISFINIMLIIKFLPETLSVKSQNRINITKPFHNLALAFFKPGIRNIMPSYTLYNAGFTFFTTFFAIIMAKKFGFLQNQIGNYFAYVGIMIVIAQGLLVRRMSGKYSDYKVLRFSMFGTGICVLIYMSIPASNQNWLYFLPPFLSSFNALSMAFFSALIARVTPEEIRGQAFGIAGSCNAIAQSFPAIISGYVADKSLSLTTFWGSIIIFTAGIAFWLLFRPQKK